LLLGAIGTAARRSGGDAGPGGYGQAPGFGYAEARAVQADRDGPARDPLHDLGAAGRELQVRSRAWLGPNQLSPLARLGAILGIAVITAIAFGGMLAGLHALSDLSHTLFRA